MRGAKRFNFEERMAVSAPIGPLLIGAGILGSGLLNAFAGGGKQKDISNIATPFTMDYLKQMGGMAPGMIGNAMNFNLNAGNSIQQLLNSGGLQSLLQSGGYNQQLEDALQRSFGMAQQSGQQSLKELYGGSGARYGTSIANASQRQTRNSLADFGVTLGNLRSEALNRQLQAFNSASGMAGQLGGLGSNLLSPFASLAGAGMPTQTMQQGFFGRLLQGAGAGLGVGAGMASMGMLGGGGGGSMPYHIPFH